MRRLIGEIESARDSRVLVFASSQLDLDMLPALYETLARIGPCRQLDVVFYSRGGIVNAARRIALLLREFAERVAFLVPHYCESAGTVAVLSADEIVAGPLAIFSPVDPLLSSSQAGGGGPHAMSAQDLRLFGEMCSQWFGLGAEEARARSLAVLCENIFPSTLTSFYRSTLEMQAICQELLACHLGDDALRQRIAETLIFGFHSHSYALTRDELGKLGLPLTTAPALEGAMWSVARAFRQLIGPGARTSVEDAWCDAFIASSQGAVARQRSEDFPGYWQERELEQP